MWWKLWKKLKLVVVAAFAFVVVFVVVIDPFLESSIVHLKVVKLIQNLHQDKKKEFGTVFNEV